VRRDDWQLEMLCNMGAAELLMPVGSLGHDPDSTLGLDEILSLRADLDVSVEAITLRLVRLARRPVAAFVASGGTPEDSYQLDYFIPSGRWALGRPEAPVPGSAIRDCVAIGYTAKSIERWPGMDDDLRVEAVAIPPYPGQRRPRVAGIVWPAGGSDQVEGAILHVRGSATEPRGNLPMLLVQVVNDRTPRWGGGFALDVAKRWPHIQRDFIEWTEADATRLRLGSVRIADAADGLRVASVVAQHGYGPSPRPRIRYGGLESGLRAVADEAISRNESVHGPRLGARQAGGDWQVIERPLEGVARRTRGGSNGVQPSWGVHTTAIGQADAARTRHVGPGVARRIVVLSGRVASGKSTLGEDLAARFRRCPIQDK
jgi:hypothetical protein